MLAKLTEIIHTRIQLQFHAEIEDVLHFSLHNRGWEAKLRDARLEHSAGERKRFEHTNAIAGESKILCSCQARRS